MAEKKAKLMPKILDKPLEHYLAKTELNFDLRCLGNRFSIKLSAKDCTNIASNLYNYTVANGRTCLSSVFDIPSMRADAFRCDEMSSTAILIKQTSLDCVNDFRMAYQISLDELSHQALQGLCKLIINSETDSEVHTEMASELDFKEKSNIFMMSKALKEALYDLY